MDDLEEIMVELSDLKKRVASVEKTQIKAESKFKKVMQNITQLIRKVKTNESEIRRNSAKG